MNQKYPPHLPPKSCSVPLHKRLRTVESVIFVTLLASFAGIVGGMLADVYVTPEYSDSFGIVRQQRAVQETNRFELPDGLFVREQYRRMLTIVEKAAYQRVPHIPAGGGMSAVLLTDTGWFVAPLPAGGVVRSQLLAIDAMGQTYDIETSVIDTAAGVWYGTVSGTGFRIASFPKLSSLAPGMEVWVTHEHTLEKYELGYPDAIPTITNTAQLGAQTYEFFLNDAPDGAVVWATDGTFLGFVNKRHTITPWFVIQSVYADVFSGQAPVHPTVPVLVHPIVLSLDDASRTGSAYGYYIDRVADDMQQADVGEIIVQVEGASIVPWQTDAIVARQKTGTVSVTILSPDGTLRDGALPFVSGT